MLQKLKGQAEEAELVQKEQDQCKRLMLQK